MASSLMGPPAPLTLPRKTESIHSPTPVQSNRFQEWYRRLCRGGFGESLLPTEMGDYYCPSPGPGPGPSPGPTIVGLPFDLASPSPQRLQLQLQLQREYLRSQELQKNCRQEWWRRQQGGVGGGGDGGGGGGLNTSLLPAPPGTPVVSLAPTPAPSPSAAAAATLYRRGHELGSLQRGHRSLERPHGVNRSLDAFALHNRSLDPGIFSRSASLDSSSLLDASLLETQRSGMGLPAALLPQYLVEAAASPLSSSSSSYHQHQNLHHPHSPQFSLTSSGIVSAAPSAATTAGDVYLAGGGARGAGFGPEACGGGGSSNSSSVLVTQGERQLLQQIRERGLESLLPALPPDTGPLYPPGYLGPGLDHVTAQGGYCSPQLSGMNLREKQSMAGLAAPVTQREWQLEELMMKVERRLQEQHEQSQLAAAKQRQREEFQQRILHLLREQKMAEMKQIQDNAARVLAEEKLRKRSVKVSQSPSPAPLQRNSTPLKQAKPHTRSTATETDHPEVFSTSSKTLLEESVKVHQKTEAYHATVAKVSASPTKDISTVKTPTPAERSREKDGSKIQHDNSELQPCVVTSDKRSTEQSQAVNEGEKCINANATEADAGKSGSDKSSQNAAIEVLSCIPSAVPECKTKSATIHEISDKVRLQTPQDGKAHHNVTKKHPAVSKPDIGGSALQEKDPSMSPSQGRQSFRGTRHGSARSATHHTPKETLNISPAGSLTPHPLSSTASRTTAPPGSTKPPIARSLRLPSATVTPLPPRGSPRDRNWRRCLQEKTDDPSAQALDKSDSSQENSLSKQEKKEKPLDKLDSSPTLAKEDAEQSSRQSKQDVKASIAKETTAPKAKVNIKSVHKSDTDSNVRKVNTVPSAKAEVSSSAVKQNDQFKGKSEKGFNGSGSSELVGPDSQTRGYRMGDTRSPVSWRNRRFRRQWSRDRPERHERNGAGPIATQERSPRGRVHPYCLEGSQQEATPPRRGADGGRGNWNKRGRRRSYPFSWPDPRSDPEPKRRPAGEQGTSAPPADQSSKGCSQVVIKKDGYVAQKGSPSATKLSSLVTTTSSGQIQTPQGSAHHVKFVLPPTEVGKGKHRSSYSSPPQKPLKSTPHPRNAPIGRQNRKTLKEESHSPKKPAAVEPSKKFTVGIAENVKCIEIPEKAESRSDFLIEPSKLAEQVHPAVSNIDQEVCGAMLQESATITQIQVPPQQHTLSTPDVVCNDPVEKCIQNDAISFYKTTDVVSDQPCQSMATSIEDKTNGVKNSDQLSSAHADLIVSYVTLVANPQSEPDYTTAAKLARPDLEAGQITDRINAAEQWESVSSAPESLRTTFQVETLESKPAALEVKCSLVNAQGGNGEVPCEPLRSTPEVTSLSKDVAAADTLTFEDTDTFYLCKDDKESASLETAEHAAETRIIVNTHQSLNCSAAREMGAESGTNPSSCGEMGMETDPSAGGKMDHCADGGMGPFAGGGIDLSTVEKIDPCAVGGMDPSDGAGMDSGGGMDPIAAGGKMDPSVGGGMDPITGGGMDPSAEGMYHCAAAGENMADDVSSIGHSETPFIQIKQTETTAAIAVTAPADSAWDTATGPDLQHVLAFLATLKSRNDNETVEGNEPAATCEWKYGQGDCEVTLGIVDSVVNTDPGPDGLEQSRPVQKEDAKKPGSEDAGAGSDGPEAAAALELMVERRVERRCCDCWNGTTEAMHEERNAPARTPTRHVAARVLVTWTLEDGDRGRVEKGRCSANRVWRDPLTGDTLL